MSSDFSFPSERAVFLVGCARSGTSIFGELVAAHPEVEYLFEVSKIWNGIFEGREHDGLSLSDAQSESQIDTLYRELHGSLKRPDAKVILEKNPKHALRVGFLNEAFPQCKFLHIVRDGRDVVSSLMFRNRGPNWGHLKVPGWEDLLKSYPEKNHLRCAHQWNRAVRCVLDESKEISADRFLQIKYEDLVTQPLQVAKAVLQFLNLEITSEVEALASKIQDETQGSYHARKQVRHYVDNHKKRIGRYQENLSPEQIAEVEGVIGDLLKELRY